jgi:hypothetical protein
VSIHLFGNLGPSFAISIASENIFYENSHKICESEALFSFPPVFGHTAASLKRDAAFDVGFLSCCQLSPCHGQQVGCNN